MNVKYPNVRVVPNDGNALSVVSAACNAAKRAGVPKQDIDNYRAEALSGDYDHVLQTTMAWFDLDPDFEDEVEEDEDEESYWADYDDEEDDDIVF